MVQIYPICDMIYAIYAAKNSKNALRQRFMPLRQIIRQVKTRWSANFADASRACVSLCHNNDIKGYTIEKRTHFSTLRRGCRRRHPRRFANFAQRIIFSKIRKNLVIIEKK